MKYKLITEELNLSAIRLRMSRIADQDALYNELIQKGENHDDFKDERIPYWAEIWPSSIGMSLHLLETRSVVKGLTVHEIGCGLGLAGIVAGKLGGQIVFSDYIPEALELASHNWSQNLSTDAGFHVMDWRQPLPELSAELILASDVAYEQRNFKVLPDLFLRLTKPGGKILVSEPNRPYAQEFFQRLSMEGFSMRKFQYNVEAGIVSTVSTTVNVFELTPQEAYLPRIK